MAHGNRACEKWGTWAIGHMSIRGRVMGHMGNVACPPSRSTWGRVMGHISNRPHDT